jgi:hypothetical protein
MLLKTDSGMPYRFESYLPGVFVELYLPKRSVYQGMLYEALTEGFDFERVKVHFLEESNRERIYSLLEHYDEIKNIEERILTIEPFYWGYSMYEVDGVFFDIERGIDEERTQIIRIMFLPNIKTISEIVPEMEYNKLRRAVKKIIGADRDEREKMKEHFPQLVDHLNKWIGDVGLFLFGYIVFKLCERINEVNTEHADELEQEIWVTSFWGLQVNKVKLVKSYS